MWNKITAAVWIPYLDNCFRVVTDVPHPDRLWDPPRLLSNGYRGLFLPEVKCPGREADNSSASSAEVKAWGYTSSPQYVFMAWFLVKHRDIFAFTLSLLTVTNMATVRNIELMSAKCNLIVLFTTENHVWLIIFQVQLLPYRLKHVLRRTYCCFYVLWRWLITDFCCFIFAVADYLEVMFSPHLKSTAAQVRKLSSIVNALSYMLV
jgi:hypothetical protein